MKKIEEFQSGVMGKVYLYISEIVYKNGIFETITATGPAGTVTKIVTSQSLDEDNVHLEKGTWYQFRNIVYISTEAKHTCQSCGSIMQTGESRGDHLVGSPKLDLDGGQFVITEDCKYTQLDDSSWILPLTQVNMDPFLWSCPECTQDGQKSSTAESDSQLNTQTESLTTRITSALKGTSEHSTERSVVETNKQRSSNLFRELLRDNQSISPSQVDMQAILGNYFSPRIFNSNETDSAVPTFKQGSAVHPIRDKIEAYVDVNINPRTFYKVHERPNINLVLAIDVSGSMGAPFEMLPNGHANHPEQKLAAVIKAITTLVRCLGSDDHLGVVLFNDHAHVARPLQAVLPSTSETLRTELQSFVPQSNTNPMAALRRAEALFNTNVGVSTHETENRILLITDTTPTISKLSADQFITTCQRLQTRDIGMSFVGIDTPITAVDRSFCRVRDTNAAFIQSSNALQLLFSEYI